MSFSKTCDYCNGDGFISIYKKINGEEIMLKKKKLNVQYVMEKD
jgi:DnaJ-class molecular chaperone